MSASKVTQISDPNLEFDKEIQKLSPSLFKLLKDPSEVEDFKPRIRTNLPRFDRLISTKNPGLPLNSDYEFLSREPGSAKTSLALTIAGACQKNGGRVAIVDIENSITASFMQTCGINLDPESGLVLPKIIQHDITQGPLVAEEIFDAVKSLSMISDVVIVDSVAAIIQESDMEKDASDPDKAGGISKLLTSHLRKTTCKRAAVLWLNQQRVALKISKYATGPSHYSMGGQALGFFASFRFLMAETEKVFATSDTTQDPIGMRIGIKCLKNKDATPYRSAQLSYLFGQAFVPEWDLMLDAIALGIIEKAGAWFTIEGERAQGQFNLYTLLADHPQLVEIISAKVDECQKNV